MHKVDLNCDLGESFGRYKLGLDEDIIKYITSANVACGFHASDPLVMANTVKLCKENKVSVGAHVGFNDLQGFGRRNMDISLDEAKAITIYQIGALKAFTKANDVKLTHVKLHGALYNMAAKDYKLSQAICEGIKKVDSSLILLGLYNSEMIKAAKYAGLKYAQEVFADRAYEDDGTLVSRKKNGAVITDTNEAIKRVLMMIKENKVESINGKVININADSICVHGDGIKAVEFAKIIREALEKENILVSSIKNII